MEEKYKKAIEDAKDLADKMLQDMDSEFATDYKFRQKALKNIDAKSDWLKFWWRANRAKVYKISAAAASVVLLITLILNISDTNDNKNPIAVVSSDIMPANGNVVLTLSSGETVQLDSNTRIEDKISGIRVDKSAGEISYAGVNSNTDNKKESQSIEYNELSVPKGRSYSIVLSDGTKVWLNALSKIKYPVQFTSGERSIELTGEAYFEVKKDVNAPFTVKTNDYKVRVLGTSFNVNAYSNENKTVTTLVTGSISIPEPNGSEKKIVAGEQYSYDRISDKAEVSKVNVELYTSWIDNLLRIEELPLEEIFKILERRYDINVNFMDKGTSAEKFTGKLPLNDNLKVVLEQLSKVSNVDFKTEDNVVSVSYKR